MNKIENDLSHKDSPKKKIWRNLIVAWALWLTLTASDNLSAQRQNTSQLLAKDMVDHNIESMQKIYIDNLAPIINSIKNIDQIPIIPKYKNSLIAKKYNLPDSIDISPKVIHRPTDLVVLALWDKKYNVIPYKWIKIKDMKLVANKNLDDPKAIISLELVGLIPRNIEISCREFANYLYHIDQVPVWHKKSFFGIHIKEVSQQNNKSKK